MGGRMSYALLRGDVSSTGSTVTDIHDAIDTCGVGPPYVADLCVCDKIIHLSCLPSCGTIIRYTQRHWVHDHGDTIG